MASLPPAAARSSAIRPIALIGGPLLCGAAIAYLILSPQPAHANVLLATAAALGLGIAAVMTGLVVQYLEARAQGEAMAQLAELRTEIAAGREEADRLLTRIEGEDAPFRTMIGEEIVIGDESPDRPLLDER